MAYDASNNKQDQNQVVSSTPLSGGQQPAAQTQPQDSQSTQAPSQPSTVQAGMSSTQAGAAQQPTQQKSASSGMFTNIQKYVQKNKPQAQKMASAVTQNVGSQASEIAEQAKQKEAQMKESLAANTAAMEAQKKEAGQIVGGIMGADYDPTTGQYQAPASPDLNRTQVVDSKQYATGGQIHGGGMVQKPGKEIDPNQNQIKAALDQSRQDNQNYNNWVQSTLGDQYDTYQQELDAIRNRQLPMDFGPGSANERAGQKNAEDIAALNEKYGVGRDIYGEQRFQELMKGPTGVSEVGNLNIAQQNQKARALQQLAGTANTEMGRRGLLQDTFRQGGKEYTQGMGSLDQLITSGDQQAREALVTGVQEQAQGLQDQLQQVGSDANKAKMAQDMAMQQFGTDISQLGADAQAAILGQVDEQVAAQRDAFTKELDDLKASASAQFGEGMKFGGVEDFYQALDDMYSGGWKTKGQQRDKLAEYSIAKARGEDVGSFADWSKRAGGVDAGRQRALNDAMNAAAAEALGLEARQVATGYGSSMIPTGYTTQYGATEEDQQALQDYINANKDTLMNKAYETTGLANLDKQMVLNRRGQDQMQQLLGDVLSQAGDYGINTSDYVKQLQDLAQASSMKKDYGWSGTQSGDLGTYRYDIDKFNETLGNIFSDIGSARENALQRQLENKYKDQYGDALGEGQTYEDFVSGDWIDRAGVANQDQTSRMAALRNLMGSQTDELGTELDGQYGQDTSFFQRLKDDLAGYKPTAKTGGTVARNTTGGGGPIKKVV